MLTVAALKKSDCSKSILFIKLLYAKTSVPKTAGKIIFLKQKFDIHVCIFRTLSRYGVETLNFCCISPLFDEQTVNQSRYLSQPLLSFQESYGNS